jgi:3-mercaptopyruvate sulfurtransferase SseA
MIPTISLEELRAKMDRKDDFALVEALPGTKYRKGHLPGAMNLPFYSTNRLAEKRFPNKDQEIIVYCGSYT